MPNIDLLHKETTQAIIAAVYAVHNELGHGFLDRVYANALSVALRQSGHHVEREVPFDIVFRGEHIGRYRGDLLVNKKVIVEVKTGNFIDPPHIAQVRNYLKASGVQVGLLVNFGPSAEFKRLVSTKPETR